jgi:acetoin utilization deacetylase AcuC-like enzyme
LPITRDEGFPPDHVGRLTCLLDEQTGTLRTTEFVEVAMDGAAPRCAIADVLRVHEYAYVKRIEDLCAGLEGDTLGSLDPDTTVSAASFDAAMHAAGAVCEGVRRVCSGEARNVFCATRPPGHHAGPAGKVTNTNDPDGSSGFCLLNNVAIGAAYARSVLRHGRDGRAGIDRVAIGECSLFTVTFHANRAHNLTRSP